MIRVNGRSISRLLAGMMNPQGLLGYLRFFKLCKNHSEASLSTLFIIFFTASCIFFTVMM